MTENLYPNATFMADTVTTGIAVTATVNVATVNINVSTVTDHVATDNVVTDVLATATKTDKAWTMTDNVSVVDVFANLTDLELCVMNSPIKVVSSEAERVALWVYLITVTVFIIMANAAVIITVRR